MECCQGSIFTPGRQRVAALLPESECKGKANFGTGKQIGIIFFNKNETFFKPFLFSFDF